MSCGGGQLVASLVFWMPRMAFDPVEGHVVALHRNQEALPQIGVYGFVLFVPLPAVGLPAFCPAFVDAVDDIFAVAVRRIRKKVDRAVPGANPIETVYGMGYRLDPATAENA